MQTYLQSVLRARTEYIFQVAVLSLQRDTAARPAQALCPGKGCKLGLLNTGHSTGRHASQNTLFSASPQMSAQLDLALEPVPAMARCSSATRTKPSMRASRLSPPDRESLCASARRKGSEHGPRPVFQSGECLCTRPRSDVSRGATAGGRHRSACRRPDCRIGLNALELCIRCRHPQYFTDLTPLCRAMPWGAVAPISRDHPI
jgi:hypothetical protein